MPGKLFDRVSVVSIQVTEVNPTGLARTPKPIKNFTPSSNQVKQAIENATDLVYGDDNSQLVYNLNVKAETGQGAKMAARRYVRMRNLFEPSIIDVGEPSETTGEKQQKGYVAAMTQGNPDVESGLFPTTYSVKVTIRK